MAKRSRTYIWQFTIGLGFLSGLWTAIGIDPEEVILNLLGTVTGEIFPDPTLRQLFILLPTLLLLISVLGAYKKGKVLGLASVLIAYMAGLVRPCRALDVACPPPCGDRDRVSCHQPAPGLISAGNGARAPGYPRPVRMLDYKEA